MKAFAYIGLWLLGVWLQVIVAPSFALWGYRPSFILLILAVLSLRWPSPWLFVYGALAGLAQDSFTHGVLGIYGMSFFAAAIGSRLVAGFIYDGSLPAAMAVILATGLIEGVATISIYEFMDPSTPWWRWLFSRILPTAFYTALWSPVFLWLHGRIERRFHLSRDTWELR